MVDWIAMRPDLPDDPKVHAIAALVDVTVTSTVTPTSRRCDAVVVALLRLWGLARERGEAMSDDPDSDCLIRSATPKWADMAGRLDGMGDAMVAVGWAHTCRDGLILPRFWSRTAAKDRARHLATQRQRRWREGRKAADSVDVTVTSTVGVTVDALSRSRGEERRVEELQPPIPPSEGGPRAAPEGAVSGASPPVNGHARKASRPKPVVDPAVSELADRFAEWIAHWKPDAKIQVRSPASLEQLRLLVEADGRNPDDVKALLAWLFGGNAAELDYAPRDPGFDWRRNVLSGTKLRKHWDVLDDLFTQTHPRETSA